MSHELQLRHKNLAIMSGRVLYNFIKHDITTVPMMMTEPTIDVQ